MRRRKRACSHKFLAMVTKRVVHSVHKVVTRLSFSVIRCHKVSGGQWTFHKCVTRSDTYHER